MHVEKDRKINKTITTPVPKTKFHNFEQRTSNMTTDELEDIARRKREEYFKISGREEIGTLS